jgi:hypothetical protein
MNAPAWLNNVVMVVMLLIAGLFVWRMLVASGWQRRTDYPRDALYALAAPAVAATQVKWFGNLVPRPAWAAVFAGAAVFFAARLVRERGAGWGAVRGHLLDAGVGVTLVYMFTAGVAPSAISGSTAGAVVMGGMSDMTRDATERFPTLGLLLVLALVGSAVVLLDRLSVSRPAVVVDAYLPVNPLDRPGPIPMLAPWTVDLGRMVLLVVMAYAILGKLV